MMDNLQLTLPVLECSLRVLAFESTSESVDYIFNENFIFTQGFFLLTLFLFLPLYVVLDCQCFLQLFYNCILTVIGKILIYSF